VSLTIIPGTKLSHTTNSSLVIGLSGLIGMLGVCTAPLVGRCVGRLIPRTGVLIGIFITASSQLIVMGAGMANIAAVIISIFLLDIGQQMQQVSNHMRVYGISDLARARLNACYIISIFIGTFFQKRELIARQAMGSKVGTRVYTIGGYRTSGALSCGWIGMNLIVLLARGPHTKKWLGWQGGAELRKGNLQKEEPGTV
jgi:hypothetical protein